MSLSFHCHFSLSTYFNAKSSSNSASPSKFRRHPFFEGEVKGEILHKKTGKNGFGYDPIFKPLGHDQSFAQMKMALKNEISHRGVAVKKLIQFLSHH